MAPERLFEKISNFKIMNILYIILQHVVWRFRIYNYFRGATSAFYSVKLCIYFYAGQAFVQLQFCLDKADKPQVMFYFPEIKET